MRDISIKANSIGQVINAETVTITNGAVNPWNRIQLHLLLDPLRRGVSFPAMTFAAFSRPCSMHFPHTPA